MFTTSPSMAMTSIVVPATATGSMNRPIASTTIQTAMPSSATPLTKAASTEKRSYPYVRFQSAGRVARCAAPQASASEAKSVSMCPASASSASEPDSDAAHHLGEHEPAGQQRDDGEPPLLARAGVVVVVPVAVVVIVAHPAPVGAPASALRCP